MKKKWIFVQTSKIAISIILIGVEQQLREKKLWKSQKFISTFGWKLQCEQKAYCEIRHGTLWIRKHFSVAFAISNQTYVLLQRVNNNRQCDNCRRWRRNTLWQNREKKTVFYFIEKFTYKYDKKEHTISVRLWMISYKKYFLFFLLLFLSCYKIQWEVVKF